MSTRSSGRPNLVKAITLQTVTELKLTFRRGESLLVTIVIPVLLLIFFSSARVLPTGGHLIDFLLAGTIALAIISTSLVSVGIATAYERYYGVLKRLGSTPFPRGAWVGAKILSVLAMEAVQVLVLVAIASVGYGWRPHGSLPAAFGAFILGTSAFTGLGLLMAGRLRAEATLAGANGLFVLFLLIGGLFVPLDHLPGWLVPVSRVLPAAPLADVLRTTLQHTSSPTFSAVVLTLWAVVSPLAAALSFRWE